MKTFRPLRAPQNKDKHTELDADRKSDPYYAGHKTTHASPACNNSADVLAEDLVDLLHLGTLGGDGIQAAVDEIHHLFRRLVGATDSAQGP